MAGHLAWLAFLFLYVPDLPHQALLSDYCIKIHVHAPITGKGIPGKIIKNDQSQRLYYRNVNF